MRLISPRVIRGNRGDLMSRWGILQAMLPLASGPFRVLAHTPKHIPPGNFEFASYGPLYNAIPTRAGLKALWKSDVVIWTGGLDLQDDSSLIKLLHTLCVFASYRLIGLRVALVMQGAGPLTTTAGRLLARAILALVSVALVRDCGTLALVQNLSGGAKARLSADGIFLEGFPGRSLDSTEVEKIDALTQRPEGAPLVLVNLRLWFHFSSGILPYQFAKKRYRERSEAGMSRFIEAMAGVVRELRQRDARVLLVSMYEPDVEPWEDDLPYLQRLKDAHFQHDDAVVAVTEALSIAGFFSLVERADLAVGTRLHACLTAIRAGVPALHIAYTLKGADIYADLDLEDMVFGLDGFLKDQRPLSNRALRILDDPQPFVTRVDRAVSGALAVNREAISWLRGKLTTVKLMDRDR